ncbi:MAG: PKD domain-containing protein [Bacteroidota bacterium]
MLNRVILLLPLIFCVFGFQTSMGQGGFTADTTFGCAPLTIQFTDTSQAAISWTWDFGNGTTSDLQHPSIIYTSPGVYDVSLRVSFLDGSIRTITQANYIQALASPQANLYAEAQVVCADYPLAFFDQSQKGSSNIVSWAWDFGDGKTIMESNPTHTYDQAGTYTLTLFVIDENSCRDFVVLPDYLEVKEKPSADFDFVVDAGCELPKNVSFTSNPESGLTHMWDFGNGTTSNDQNPVAYFETAATYTVTHMVTNRGGCQDTLTQIIPVSQDIPGSEIILSSDTVCAQEEIFFGLNPSGATQVLWDFGDGVGTSISQAPSHVYTAAGAYQVSAILNEGTSCEQIISNIVTVLPSPEGDFKVDKTFSCTYPLDALFSATYTGATDIQWDFGFTDTTSVDEVSISYTESGWFGASLSLTNDIGCTTTVSKDSLIQIYTAKADFDATSTGGCAPNPTRLFPNVDNPTSVNSYRWDFGDGNSSRAESPTHVYTDVGAYDVSLVIEYENGCLDTVIKDDFIGAGELPTLTDFDANPKEACLENGIKFRNFSPDSVTTTATWFFGDGSNSNAWEPYHYYPDTGYYDVTLVISNYGCKDSVQKLDFIQIIPPKASFITDKSAVCNPPEKVKFIDSSVGADTYFWDFGGFGTSTELNPEFEFTEVGEHRVRLTVTNDQTGCKHQFDQTVYVQPVKADFEQDRTIGCSPLSVFFKDKSENASEWRWEVNGNFGSVLQNPKLTFEPGLYTLSLIAANQWGCRDTLTKDTLINVRGPKADFEADGRIGCAPHTSTFTSLTTVTSPVALWEWDFGNSTFSTEESPIATYDSSGYYDVKLTVTDEEGCVDSTMKPQYIVVGQAVAEFHTPFPINCIGNPVPFVNESQGDSLSYLWDFGDGNTSTEANPEHIYTRNGTYTVSLSISGINGCSDVRERLDYITIKDLIATINADTSQSSCPPLLVGFTSDNAINDNIVNWFWDFGDGTTSNDESPSHLYTQAGIYDITLIIENAAGCTDTLILDDFVQIKGPVGSFTFTPDRGCPGLEVSFEATGKNVDTYKWDFDDGNVPFGQNQQHVYDKPGRYFPKLIIDDGLGCSVLLVSPTPVEILIPPAADFTTASQVGCDGTPVTLENNTFSNDSIASYTWYLGDGNTAETEDVTHLYATSGQYDISLVVTDINGCMDSLNRPGYMNIIPDSVPEAPPIHFVSVLSDTEVEVHFSPYENKMRDFDRYRVYRTDENGTTLIYESTILIDTFFIDKGINTLGNSYCYAIEVVNYCGSVSDIQAYAQHCTIELATVGDTSQIHLSWNPYQGWEVESYQIYRVESYDMATAKLIGQVPATVTDFTDTDMYCRLEQTYRVEALSEDGNTYSRSDTSLNRPFKALPEEIFHMELATVAGDEDILIRWQLPDPLTFSKVYIEKGNGSSFNPYFSQEVSAGENVFIDSLVDVHSSSYAYQVIAEDTCGDLTLAGRMAKSILLTAERLVGTSQLSWTPYEEWEQGVVAYKIEVFNEQKNVFEWVSTVAGNITSYSDEKTLLDQATYCYRVIGIQAEDSSIQSISNLDCVSLPPTLYSPNAFTPNGDGYNDYFNLSGVFISSYELSIYSRWGMKIFQTYSMEAGWDGILEEGGEAPEGVYTYVAKATGFDGTVYTKRGTVTLIR